MATPSLVIELESITTKALHITKFRIQAPEKTYVFRFSHEDIKYYTCTLRDIHIVGQKMSPNAIMQLILKTIEDPDNYKILMNVRAKKGQKEPLPQARILNLDMIHTGDHRNDVTTHLITGPVDTYPT